MKHIRKIVFLFLMIAGFVYELDEAWGWTGAETPC